MAVTETEAIAREIGKVRGGQGNRELWTCFQDSQGIVVGAQRRTGWLLIRERRRGAASGASIHVREVLRLSIGVELVFTSCGNSRTYLAQVKSSNAGIIVIDRGVGVQWRPIFFFSAASRSLLAIATVGPRRHRCQIR